LEFLTALAYLAGFLFSPFPAFGLLCQRFREPGHFLIHFRLGEFQFPGPGFEFRLFQQELLLPGLQLFLRLFEVVMHPRLFMPAFGELQEFAKLGLRLLQLLAQLNFGLQLLLGLVELFRQLFQLAFQFLAALAQFVGLLLCALAPLGFLGQRVADFPGSLLDLRVGGLKFAGASLEPGLFSARSLLLGLQALLQPTQFLAQLPKLPFQFGALLAELACLLLRLSAEFALFGECFSQLRHLLGDLSLRCLQFLDPSLPFIPFGMGTLLLGELLLLSLLQFLTQSSVGLLVLGQLGLQPASFLCDFGSLLFGLLPTVILFRQRLN
jgi:hypothetical protein